MYLSYGVARHWNVVLIPTIPICGCPNINPLAYEIEIKLNLLLQKGLTVQNFVLNHEIPKSGGFITFIPNIFVFVNNPVYEAVWIGRLLMELIFVSVFRTYENRRYCHHDSLCNCMWQPKIHWPGFNEI